MRESADRHAGRYGLQLDSVSLTALDQTPFAALDENNAFNAVGMRKLAEVIAKSKKERAEIDADSEVSVRRAAMEGGAAQAGDRPRRAPRADRPAAGDRDADRRADRRDRRSARPTANAPRRARASRWSRTSPAADIAKEQILREAEIAQALALEVAEQNRAISFAAKSQEESRAHADADTARIEAVKASEAVQTARQMAEAERRKGLALIAAQEQAEAAAASAKITAASDKATAADKTAAKREEAEALKAMRLAEAEANLAQIEAENARSDAQVAMELEIARLKAMPLVLAEMVKPAEKIDRISINQFTGLSRGEPGQVSSPVNQTVDAILDLAVSLPSMQKLGDAVGVNLDKALSPKPRKDG